MRDALSWLCIGKGQNLPPLACITCQSSKLQHHFKQHGLTWFIAHNQWRMTDNQTVLGDVSCSNTSFRNRIATSTQAAVKAPEAICVCRIAYIDMPKGLVCFLHSVLQSCTMPNLPDSRSFKMPCVASSEACLRSRLNGSNFKPCSTTWDASLYLSRPASNYRWHSL